MALQRRLNYGFINGYEVPPNPRATRSARRRVPFRKKVDDNQICAFDLLATVAGKLLQEGETTPSSTEMFTGKEKKDSVLKEQQAEDSLEKVKLSDERSFGDASSGLASVLTTSDCSEKFVSSAKLVNSESKIEHGNSDVKVDVESCCRSLSLGCKLDDINKNHIKVEPPMSDKEAISARVDMLCSEDHIVRDIKTPALVSSDNSIELSHKPSFLDERPQKALFRPHRLRSYFHAHRDDVKLVNRDDDENSSGCTQPSTLRKGFRPPLRIGDRKIRRTLTAKYWKASPNMKDEDQFCTGSETKLDFRNRVNCHKRLRSLRDYPIKKRRLYEHSLVANADDRVSSDGASSSPRKVSNGDAFVHDGTSASAFAAGQQPCLQERDSHVKLKIKSFRVPELFIDIPETETIGSLKRIVMEAVTSMLSGGLQVSVLLQGKKIRDDNKTLMEIGISDSNKIDFTLEPNSSQVPPPLCPKDQFFLLPCDTSESLTRGPRAPIVVPGNSDVSPELPLANFGNISDHDSAASPPEMLSVEKSQTDSRALVSVPEMNVEALAAVPLQKPKRSDVGQRRIRRPFSVSEVEALVQAVEKLGTGRWRDVKNRAFDNAKHRTYVDLKDKWKTLVHTARISPQQRRGEPVPQELLDRVLAAHAFWSHHQAKQQVKKNSEV